MRTLRNCLSVVLGVAVAAAVLVVTGAGPDAAKGAPQAKEQAYEANFECAIPAGSANCAVAADKEIPAGKRLRVESIKARMVMPTATKTAFEFYMELRDPSAARRRPRDLRGSRSRRQDGRRFLQHLRGE